MISLRLLRPSIVVLCGPAACGKSTFAQRHFRPTQIISSDWARAHLCDDERDQRYNVQAFALVHFIVEQRLMVNRLCVVDSTALTSGARKELLDLAKKYQVPTTLILFNVPLQTCLERDQKRERSVGSAVIERQYQAFEQTRESIRQEGFDRVLEYQDGDLDKIQIEILFRPVARPPQRPVRPNGPGASRRFERSPQPYGPPSLALGDNGRGVLTTSPATAGHPAPPQPATIAHFDSPPKIAPTRPGGPPAPVAASRAVAAAPASGAPGMAMKPALQPPPGTVTRKPASQATPEVVPAGAQTSGPR